MDLDEEFQHIHEVRKIGWPYDTEAQNIIESKKQFMKALDIGDKLHSLIWTDRKSDEWKAATCFFSVASFLRDIEHRFTKKPVSLNTNSPTKDPNAMECNNCVLGICSEHGSQKKIDDQQEINNLAERTCRNEKCDVKFMPKKVTFVCCGIECHKVYKTQKFKGGERPSKPFQSKPSGDRRKSKKTLNNAQEINSSQSSEVSKSKRFFITPFHVYNNDPDVPSKISDSLFDTGAGPTVVTLEFVNKLKLNNQMVETVPKEVLGGDTRPMIGSICFIWLELAIEDTIGILTDKFKVKASVYKSLNHEIIVGRDSMCRGLRNFVTFPNLDVSLFNATSRMYKKFNRATRDNIRVANNIRIHEISAEEAHKVDILNAAVDVEKCLTSPIPALKSKFNVSKSRFDETETFCLTVPCSKFKKDNFKKFNNMINNLTCNFMSSLEDSETNGTLMSKVLTEDGLDGFIDKSPIHVSDTKILETKKGPVKVGDQLSDEMCKNVISYVNSYSGEVFNTETLGKTKQTCDPE